jgi:hypothetical protein
LHIGVVAHGAPCSPDLFMACPPGSGPGMVAGMNAPPSVDVIIMLFVLALAAAVAAVHLGFFQ